MKTIDRNTYDSYEMLIELVNQPKLSEKQIRIINYVLKYYYVKKLRRNIQQQTVGLYQK